MNIFENMTLQEKIDFIQATKSMVQEDTNQKGGSPFLNFGTVGEYIGNDDNSTGKTQKNDNSVGKTDNRSVQLTSNTNNVQALPGYNGMEFDPTNTSAANLLGKLNSMTQDQFFGKRTREGNSSIGSSNNVVNSDVQDSPSPTAVSTGRIFMNGEANEPEEPESSMVDFINKNK